MHSGELESNDISSGHDVTHLQRAATIHDRRHENLILLHLYSVRPAISQAASGDVLLATACKLQQAGCAEQPNVAERHAWNVVATLLHKQGGRPLCKQRQLEHCFEADNRATDTFLRPILLGVQEAVRQPADHALASASPQAAAALTHSLSPLRTIYLDAICAMLALLLALHTHMSMCAQLPNARLRAAELGMQWRTHWRLHSSSATLHPLRCHQA